MSELDIDAKLVKTLAALLDETGLSEIEYAVGERRIRVAKGAAVAYAALPAAAAPAAAAAANAAPAAPPRAGDHPGAVKSPMVGTVYLAPQPEAPPFAKVGDRISEGQVILIVEAMKVMNQIRATRAGTLREVLVADGEPVEFGQPLMIID
jgi:acetyl-CoA carboxylase biotin carboxyl carrier protein